MKHNRGHESINKIQKAVRQVEAGSHLGNVSFVYSNYTSVELLNVPNLIKLWILSLSMAIKGYKMPLQSKDLWSLNLRDSSKVTVPKLLKEWEKEQAKAKRYVCKRRGGGMDEWGMYC